MVEQEEKTIQEVQDRLVHAGFEMFTAHDGRIGLQMAKDKVPDLIITDAVVPIMSGFELCKAIKLDASINAIPIVVLTEKHRMEESFMFLGIRDILNKPLSMEELENVVKNRLNIDQTIKGAKTKILIYGRAEVLVHCQQLLKDSTHWTPYMCYNSESLLREAIKYVPDVIFIDLLMPGVPADDMIKKLKMIPELKSTAILTYYAPSSVSRDPYAIQAQIIEVQYMKRVTKEAGAKEYLGPFNPFTLLSLLDMYRRDFNFII
jgi:DNA-binding response OmpR family regulator